MQLHRTACFHLILFSLIARRVNIEIFGCLLKNAIVRRNCFYIVDLLKRAVKMNLALDEKAVKLLDKFKRETSEAIAKHVSIHSFPCCLL